MARCTRTCADDQRYLPGLDRQTPCFWLKGQNAQRRGRDGEIWKHLHLLLSFETTHTDTSRHVHTSTDQVRSAPARVSCLLPSTASPHLTTPTLYVRPSPRPCVHHISRLSPQLAPPWPGAKSQDFRRGLWSRPTLHHPKPAPAWLGCVAIAPFNNSGPALGPFFPHAQSRTPELPTPLCSHGGVGSEACWDVLTP